LNTFSFRRFAILVVVLAIGVGIGAGLDRLLTPRPTAVAPVSAALVLLPAQAAPVRPAKPAADITVEVRATFDNNIYPSLLLSFAAADPAFTRCLTVAVTGAVKGQSYQLELSSGLLERSAVQTVTAPSDHFELHPLLPWNYGALRGVIQLRPETFLATLKSNAASANAISVDTSTTCMVHPVNEVVSRIFNVETDSWQDMSICYAAFVNEDHPWINQILSEATQRDGLARFSGYEFGSDSVVRQMRAVWDALAARGMSYADLATTSGAVPDVNTQYVRFLDQTLHDQGANCVDASVLLASVFRRIGLRPVLIFKPGHCFVAVYDAAQGGQLIGLETTLLSAAPFGSAFSMGAQELNNTIPHLGSPGYSSVDIAVARQAGVRPIEFSSN
jgi:hypothetical protein